MPEMAIWARTHTMRIVTDTTNFANLSQIINMTLVFGMPVTANGTAQAIGITARMLSKTTGARAKHAFDVRLTAQSTPFTLGHTGGCKQSEVRRKTTAIT